MTAQEYTQAKVTLEKLTHERAAYFAKRYQKKTSFKRRIRRKGMGKPAAQNSHASLKQFEHPAASATGAKNNASHSNAPTSPLTSAVDRIQGLVELPETTLSAAPNGSAKREENVSAMSSAAGLVIHASGVAGMEMQLGTLAQLVSKLSVKARTTSNTTYYEILRAQIVNLQHQMTQLSLTLETEKAKAGRSLDQAGGANKLKA